jgi:hypothetical protein
MILIWLLGSGARWDEALSVLQGTVFMLQCDEDINSMDTAILVPSCPKANQLYIKIKFDTFEQLMLHYDFCAFSFSELLDWIKPCVEII